MRLEAVTPEIDTRDRVIRLEAKVDAMCQRQAETDKKVTEMHELLLRARGAKYVIVGCATVGGFFAGKLAWLFPWGGGHG